MMEFEEDHEEEEEEEEEDEEMAITPTFKSTTITSASTNDAIINKKPGPIAACRYRECLKNHAVGLGGHAVDGCGEFMPAGVEGTLDALKCAACNCHRNFHRKEILLDSSGTLPNHQLALFSPGGRPPSSYHPQPQQPQVYQFYPYNRTAAANPNPNPSPSPTYLHVSSTQQHPRGPLALPSPTPGGTLTPQEQNKEEEFMMMGSCGGGGGGSTSSRKKRFRTKFTHEQKDKMLQLAEQLGWKIQKQDEVLVQQFCDETGIKRHVLKVWMHNNKHTLEIKNTHFVSELKDSNFGASKPEREKMEEGSSKPAG